jgi:3-hydroxy-9,10-secoandrosta-1,3,5(10)-triene-9,17-dione monooxygenase reductase component
MARPELTPIARALGRIPSGLYIVTTVEDGRPIGFLGSFVQQLGFDPPVVCVAVAKNRPHLAHIEGHGGFALSVLDEASQGAKSAFLRRLPEGVTPFDGLRVGPTATGRPVLLEALAWVDCRLTGKHDVGDHVVVFGTVIEGALQREGDPHVHLRKNGLGY